MSLLDNHPQLVVLPEETHYLEDRRCYQLLGTYRDKLRHLVERSGLGTLALGRFEPPADDLDSGARDYSHFDYARFVSLAENFINRPWIDDSLLFSETVRAYGAAMGAGTGNCVRWIEKTPKNETFARAMDELFPDAKLIQIVRDPRAVFASLKNRLIRQNGHYTKAHRLVRSWNRCAREIPRLQHDPARFLVIRYEDLVRKPREILETVCQFGGFEFRECLFEPTRGGNGWEGNSAFDKAFNGISAASVDQWKECLTEDEIWWIELHCRQGMALANYPLETGARFSASRWLKRLPGESWPGYIRARRASLCQGLGLLKDCSYRKRNQIPPANDVRQTALTQ